MRTFVQALLIALTFSIPVTAVASSVQAAELVVVDLRSCTYCAKFRREVAPTYDTTAAGMVAPLRSVSPLKRWPSDLAGINPVPYTPVFILVDHGREIGRFAGYTSAERFWSQLNPLIARL